MFINRWKKALAGCLSVNMGVLSNCRGVCRPWQSNLSGLETLLSHYIWRGKNHSFEHNNVNKLARDVRWFERVVKNSMYVNLEWPSLNRGGGLQHYLSPSYNAVLSLLHKQLNNHSHLSSPWPSSPQEGQLGQQPTSGPKDSETRSSHVSLTTL